LAQDLQALLRGPGDRRGVLGQLQERCSVIEGRGACRHPDGVVRLVESALRVFAGPIEEHVKGVPCPAVPRYWVFVPEIEHESQLVWE
jgi:NADH:ubiquinone oxidoreductase subunit F (NADH-binding)